ncbi:MAG: squalene/phytoene synthase family protein [Anaerolineales bacterium]|nr:squalene/phytoene synthase family protein [Anaerolineales bacterium]
MDCVNDNLASDITKASSKQAFYTVRFLVDRGRVADAYRSYAYFRWVDDVLDAAVERGGPGSDVKSPSRREFLRRQERLLERCCRGEAPQVADPREGLLVALVRSDREKDSGLRAYLRNMMRVMAFDVERRGRVITRSELAGYTRWLAVAVTENMHHFIGHDSYAPRDETRYAAVSGAHVAHMIRDTCDDAKAGYYNIPREVLEESGIGPQELDSPAYRSWVKGRVQLARGYFKAGKRYFRRVRCLRNRLAGFAYMARFEWFLDTIEREGFRVRSQYEERKSARAGFQTAWLALASLFSAPEAAGTVGAVVAEGQGKI